MGARLGRNARWLLPLFLLPLLSSCGGTGVIVVVGNEFDQNTPSLQGTMVAWEDSRNEEAGDGTDVYARDMTATPGPETLIAGGHGDQEQPAVSDLYIVWVDEGDIRARLRSGGNTVNVVTGQGDQFDPAVCGSLVVWTDMRNGNPDIFGRDLAGGQEFPIAATPATEAYPDCDGSRVVYMSTSPTTGADISMVDRTTGATVPVSAQPWNEWQPAISGSHVVWQAWPNQPDTTTGIQISGVDLNAGAPFVVTTGPKNQTMPDISGTIVVWQDERGTNPEVWFRDLAGTEQPVANTGGYAPPERAPQVSGRRVAWQQQVNGSWDIDLRELP